MPLKKVSKNSNKTKNTNSEIPSLFSSLPTIPMNINRCYGFKNGFSFVHSQVRDHLAAALGPLGLPFAFDVNNGPNVLECGGGKLELYDRYNQRIPRLERNVLAAGALLLAPISLVDVHWSLMAYYNGKVYLYHTNNYLGPRNRTVKYAVEHLFGKYQVEVLKSFHCQQDEMACGAYIIAAAIQLALCLVRGKKPKISFGLDEVAWILATKSQVTEGEEDSNPPVVKVPYSDTGVAPLFYCPLCTERKVSFRKRYKVERHLLMAHGEKNHASMVLAGMAHQRRREMEEAGLSAMEERMKFVVDEKFLNKLT